METHASRPCAAAAMRDCRDGVVSHCAAAQRWLAVDDHSANAEQAALIRLLALPDGQSQYYDQQLPVVLDLVTQLRGST